MPVFNWLVFFTKTNPPKTIVATPKQHCYKSILKPKLN
jgi:hypothetical protein